MNLALNICEWFPVLAILYVFGFSLIHRNKRGLFPIQLYIGISLLVNALLKSVELLPKLDPENRISSVTMNIYSLLEISLLYIFLYTRITGKRYRISMISFFVVYFSVCISFWFGNHKALYSFGPALFGLEDLFIAIPCLFYIYEIMKSDLDVDFKSDANFIITCGILFYFSITTPYFLAYYNLAATAPIFLHLCSIFNAIFYGLLFLSFLKAYLCTIPKQAN
jgi:hypothetical protein